MSDYHLVSTLHASRLALADARKAAATIQAAEAQVAAASAAVDAALADGRVVSSKHLLDLNLDCLGAILSHLGPKDTLYTSHTCTTLRSALFRGGLPGPLAGVCVKSWDASRRPTTAAAAAALRALEGMEPALGAQRLEFQFLTFDEGHARVLARALDAAPRAARIDITPGQIEDVEQMDRLVDILLSPDRGFAELSQVHVHLCLDIDVFIFDELRSCLTRLVRAGVCVESIQGVSDNFNLIVLFAANTLTKLHIHLDGAVHLTTQFPELRQLSLNWDAGPFTPLKRGFGFEPGRFARFVAAIQGVTRVRFGNVNATLSQNENENLGQLTGLHTLRDLEISCERTCAALDPPSRALVAEDVITNLPPLPPGLTRLAFSRSTRVAFRHPLPELRVLDCRGARGAVSGTSFYWDEEDGVAFAQNAVRGELFVPIAFPSAAIAPNLHTLLIGYNTLNHSLLIYGTFDLGTLVAARTALRVVVIENAQLVCRPPTGFDRTTAGFAALLARDAKDLVSFHMHGCDTNIGHGPAVLNFVRALEERSVRVCRTGVGECLFCMLHDGTDLWPRRWR